MEVGSPDPAAPAAVVGAVTVTGLAWLAGLQAPLIPTLPVLWGGFWLACRERRWLWRPLGRIGQIVVPLTPAVGFAGLVALNRLTTLSVPPAPGGVLTVLVLLLAGAWLGYRIRAQHLVERTRAKTHLLTWKGAQPRRDQLLPFAGSAFGIVIARSTTEGPAALLSVELYVYTLVGSLTGIGIVAAVSSERSLGNVTTYTAFESGLLIEKIQFVEADEIRGYERTDSTLTIRTDSRLDDLLGTRLFGTRRVQLSDIDDVEAVCRVLDGYQHRTRRRR